jgi:hypothetical protein
MELLGILKNVIKENVNTKKVLLEYPEPTIKKLADKFSKQTEDTEEEIRAVISDFNRFKAAFSGSDKDIFQHTYEKVKKLVDDKKNKQTVKKGLEELTQDYIKKYKDTHSVDLELTKKNIKKFFELKSHLPKNNELKKDIMSFNPSEFNDLIMRNFDTVNNRGVNEFIVNLSQKFHNENPDEDVFTQILPRVKNFVRYFDMIPLRSKLTSTMSFEEFEHLIDGYTPMDESDYDIPEVDVSDTEIPYEDDDILIYNPDKKHKCINIRRKHKPDGQWCTSREGSLNMFYNYRLSKNLTLYYVIQKNLKQADTDFTSVILVAPDGSMRLADGTNSGRYSGHETIPWSEIVSKIPQLKGKEKYFIPKPYTSEEMSQMNRYKTYKLSTNDPIAELGGEDNVELWMELATPNFAEPPYEGNRGDTIFSNLTDDMQKKYISDGNILTFGMVKSLSPSVAIYYASKKTEKLLAKSLKELSGNDIGLITNDVMRPYHKKLKEKYKKELDTTNDDTLTINFNDDNIQTEGNNTKYVRMFGMSDLFDITPKNIKILTITNTGKNKVDVKIPDSLGSFKNLESITFNNCISSLPSVFTGLQNLDFFSVNNNPDLITIPSTIGDVEGLMLINAENTGIKFEKLPRKILENFEFVEEAGILMRKTL